MSPPKQKPGRSEQVVRTPRALLDSIENDLFWPIEFDLACTRENCVAIDGFYGDEGQDALTLPWPMRSCWLNPPYANIGAWAKKCCEEQANGCKIAMLVPASVGSNWFRNFVFEKADVLFLYPRVTFVGHDHPFPKDLMLCLYGTLDKGIGMWNWNS